MIDLAAGAVAALLLLLFAWSAQSPATLAGRAEIIDGDTLRIGSVRVRLAGIDAPEREQTCTASDGSEWICGQDAKAFLAAAVSRKTVKCMARGRDRYGRTLARCGVDGVDLGQSIIEAGWAVADGDYFPLENVARADRRGIWAGTFIAPAQWRRSHDGEPNLWDWIRGWFG